MSYPLQGQRILVTRPAPFHRSLIRAIAHQGGQPIWWSPVICRAKNPSAIARQALRTSQGAVHIFISRQAVIHSMPWLRQYAIRPAHIWTMGVGSARQLRRYGLLARYPTRHQNSEGLMRYLQQHYPPQQAIIHRGHGGREILRQQLMKRGWQVRYFESYQRLANPLPLPLTLNRAKITAIVATSDILLRNLLQFLPGNGRKIPVVTLSQRSQKKAQQLGFEKVWCTPRAHDRSVVQTLIDKLPVYLERDHL